VINYDLPNCIDDYVHRIGRTGRAGNVGLATAFFTNDDKNIGKHLVKLLAENRQELPDWLVRTTQAMRKGGNGRYGKGNGRGFGKGNGRGFGKGNGRKNFFNNKRSGVNKQGGGRNGGFGRRPGKW